MVMRVMPVSVSPFNSAAWMGEGPRYFGSNEAWTLMQVNPSVMLAGKIMP